MGHPVPTRPAFPARTRPGGKTGVVMTDITETHVTLVAPLKGVKQTPILISPRMDDS